MLLLPQVGPPVHPPWHYPPPGIVGQGIRALQVAWVMRTQATIGPGVLGQPQGLREGLGMLSALHGPGGMEGVQEHRLLLMDPCVSMLSRVQSHGL